MKIKMSRFPAAMTLIAVAAASTAVLLCLLPAASADSDAATKDEKLSGNGRRSASAQE